MIAPKHERSFSFHLQFSITFHNQPAICKLLWTIWCQWKFKKEINRYVFFSLFKQVSVTVSYMHWRNIMASTKLMKIHVYRHGIYLVGNKKRFYCNMQIVEHFKPDRKIKINEQYFFLFSKAWQRAIILLISQFT